MFRIFVVCLSLFLTPVLASETELELFSSGQGNTILVRHRSQAMLIDAGSSEMRFPAAYREKTTTTQKIHLLEPSSEDKTRRTSSLFERLRASKLRTNRDDDEDSKETSSGGASSEEDMGAQQGGSKKKSARSRKQVATYKVDLIEKIRSRLRKEDDGILHLKTLVVTHPDKDHYNLIPDIFSEEDFHIENLVLGGLYREYNPAFRAWLNTSEKHFTNPPIFTGRADGGTGDGSTLLNEAERMSESPRGYARPYYSAMEGKTPTELRIEKALEWTAEGGGETPPMFEILSMNAGHALEQNAARDLSIVRRANNDKNVNSIVLRLSKLKHSVLLTGDAEQPTWDHISSIQQLLPAGARPLETDYVILSHHGSKEGGATPIDLLRDLFKPKACFISVGRNTGYGHPSLSTISGVLSLSSLLEEQTVHPISYFSSNKDKKRNSKSDNKHSKRTHRRKHISKALFSTLNNGDLLLDLNEDAFIVRSSQMKETILSEETDSSGGGGKAHSPGNFLVNYSEVYVPKEAMSATVTEIANQLKTESTNLILWELTSKRNIKKTAAQEPQNTDFEQQVNLLVDKTNNRLYYLDEIYEEEEDEDESEGGGGGSGKAPTAAAQTNSGGSSSRVDE